MLLLRVWGKKWTTIISSPSFLFSSGIFCGFSCVIQLINRTSIPGAGSPSGNGYLAFIYITKSWISSLSIVFYAILVIPGVFITSSPGNATTSFSVSQSSSDSLQDYLCFPSEGISSNHHRQNGLLWRKKIPEIPFSIIPGNCLIYYFMNNGFCFQVLRPSTIFISEIDQELWRKLVDFFIEIRQK